MSFKRRNEMKKLVLFIVALMMLTPFANAGEQSTKIEARIAEYMKAWNSGNHEGVLAIYDKGFYAFADTVKPARDREAFAKLLEAEVVDYPNMKIETTSLKIHGSYAYQLGTAAYDLGDTGRGKSDLLNIWKKDDKGVWKLHIEVWWNSLSDAENDKKVRAEIKLRIAELTKAWNSGDHKAVLAVYYKDFLLVADGEEPTSDREAFGKELESEVKEYPDIKYETTTLKAQANLAFETGFDTYSMKGEDGKNTRGKGEYLVVWQKDDQGVWNVQLDIWWDSGSDEKITEKKDEKKTASSPQ
jgi:ketosteroid isomerase-like protein